MEFRPALPPPSEVHVWTVELVADRDSADACFRSLSADERERASRFRFEHLRTAFTLSHGILRWLLGRYLAVQPDRVGFAYGERGKPRLAFPAAPIEFNMAHSGRYAAYAFAVGCEVGVDIEEVRSISDQENVVQRFFSPAECEEWLDLDPSQRGQAFFRCWTRKEAYIKALGDGLSIPLDSFRVSLRPGVPASVIDVRGDAAAAGRWRLSALAAPDGYEASLALPGQGRIVRQMPFLTADAVLKLERDPGPFPPFPDSSA
jgi:4'-phosphopantetheinyl transferase